MADYTQTQHVLLSHQACALGSNIIGTAQDVNTYLGGKVYLYKAKATTTPDLVAGLDYISIQISPDASGNNWIDFFKVIPTSATANDQVLSATEPVGETVIALADTTGFDAGDFVYINDGSTVTDSEWAEVIDMVTNTSITLADGLLVEKTSADTVYDAAERWVVSVPFDGVQRIRVIVVHQGETGSTWHVKAILEAVTDIE